MARIHLLIDELPHYVGFGPEFGPQHKGHSILNATPDLYRDAGFAQESGTFPDDFVIEALMPSVTIAGIARPGQWMLELGVRQLSYHRKGSRRRCPMI